MQDCKSVRFLRVVVLFAIVLLIVAAGAIWLGFDGLGERFPGADD